MICEVRSVATHALPSKRRVKTLPWTKSAKKYCPCSASAFAAIDIAAGDRLPDAVVIKVDRRDRRSAGERSPPGKNAGPSNAFQP